jgi:hypothetical protein
VKTTPPPTLPEALDEAGRLRLRRELHRTSMGRSLSTSQEILARSKHLLAETEDAVELPPRGGGRASPSADLPPKRSRR